MLGQEKNILVLVIGWVDFGANKKKCGPQNKYDAKKNTESGIFSHLSIIDIHVHLHSELLTCTFSVYFLVNILFYLFDMTIISIQD